MDKVKLNNFIKRGNEIEEKYKMLTKKTEPIMHSRDYKQWMSEIKIFLERELKGHPLYKTMNDAYFFRDSKDTAFDEMMGCLQTLLNDTEQLEPEVMMISIKERTYMEQKNLLDNLLSVCNKMKQSISENQIWNLNDGVNAPEQIEKSTATFRKFKMDIDTYFSLFPSSEQQKANALLERPVLDFDWLEDMDVFLHSLENKALLETTASNTTINTTKTATSKVFIVHGHDNEAKVETARIIEKLGLEAIILHEQASSGDTIIEKIERYSDVGFAIVLYTPCDEGHSKGETIQKNRARQNVVFEHGYLIGKLGRSRVCALVKGEVETPGDISGVVYVTMDNAGAWRYTLVDEMNAVGFNLNKNSI